MEFGINSVYRVIGFFTLLFGLLKLYSLKYTKAAEFDIIVALTLLYVSTKLLL